MSDDDDCDLPGCLDDAMMDVPEAMMDGLKTAEKAAIAVGGKTRDQPPHPATPRGRRHVACRTNVSSFHYVG